jgi:hypothetical protein
VVRFTKAAAVSAFAVVAIAAPLASAAGVISKPTLRIVDQTPLTVRGMHFAANEGVSVSAVVRNSEAPRISRQKKTTRSGPAGGFTARLTTVELGACPVILVTATGASGDTASAKLIPECSAS